MDGVLTLAKALSDESRVRLVLALRGGELCVCQMVELLALAPSTVSKHMTILRQAGLVALRKEGRWAHYRLVGTEAPAPVRQALTWVVEAAGAGARAEQDRQRLEEILRLDKGELCRAQRDS